MGLSIGVGELVLVAEDDDSDFLDEVREEFAVLSRALIANGLPQHNEPEDFELPRSRSPVDGFPYSYLHYLRRFASYVLDVTPQLPTPIREDDNPAEDPRVATMSTPQCHLIYHSDCEGYYVPIDFEQVIADESVTGQFIGSTYRLMDELVRIAPHLGINLEGRSLADDVAEELSNQILNDAAGDFATEKMVWFALFDAAEQSIKYKSAITFG